MEWWDGQKGKWMKGVRFRWMGRVEGGQISDGEIDRWIDRWMYTRAEKRERIQKKKIEKDCN